MPPKKAAGSPPIKGKAPPAQTGPTVEEAKSLVAEICGLFYGQGWVGGTGGGLSIKAGDGSIVMAPSGVQKERMKEDDMFVLDASGEVIHTPAAKPPPARPPKLSECSPLFMAAYELRDAGAVIHSHSLNAVLATILDPEATEFKVTHLEMIKGIQGHGYYGNCIVPIIENTARECELTDRLRQAIKDYPNSCAVLVRRHGVYVWGKDWIQAKTQAESYDYLFAAAREMHALGIDASRPPGPPGRLVPPAATASKGNGATTPAGDDGPATKRHRGPSYGTKVPTCVVLDIEGTVAPISFVADVMFPYARQHVRRHLEDTYGSEEGKEDVQLIRQQAAEDVAKGVEGACAVPEDDGSNRPVVIDAVVQWVNGAIAKDRKVPALKTLQGHIWRQGFTKGEMTAELYRDVPDALTELRQMGIKTYIYSSGSREAQRLFFGHSQVGDLRPYLCGFFDTSSGPKAEARSYRDIALSLGVDSPSELLFATDVHAEAVAARAAGWQAVLVTRPGNKELPAEHDFRVISTLKDLLP